MSESTGAESTVPIQYSSGPKMEDCLLVVMESAEAGSTSHLVFEKKALQCVKCANAASVQSSVSVLAPL